MKKVITSIVIFLFCPSVFAWKISNTTITHVQAGYNNYFYMTIEADTTTVSGCSTNNHWLAMDLANAGEKEKAIMSFALSAYISGKSIEVGSLSAGCISGENVANIDYIQVGTPNN